MARAFDSEDATSRIICGPMHVPSFLRSTLVDCTITRSIGVPARHEDLNSYHPLDHAFVPCRRSNAAPRAGTCSPFQYIICVRPFVLSRPGQDWDPVRFAEVRHTASITPSLVIVSACDTGRVLRDEDISFRRQGLVAKHCRSLSYLPGTSIYSTYETVGSDAAVHSYC